MIKTGFDFDSSHSELNRYISQLTLLHDHQQAEMAVLNAIKLRKADALTRAVFENSFDAIFVIDDDGRIELANKSAATMFSTGQDDFEGLDLADFVPDISTLFVGSQRKPVGNGGFVESEAIRMGCVRFPVEVSLGAIPIGNEKVQVAVVRDITDRKQQQAELEFRAFHDPLTGLPNRSLMNNRLSHALEVAKRDGKPLALMILDLDRFKDVNDTLGHSVGDMMLCDVAKRLRSAVRRVDTVARFGGDEFAILLPSVTCVRHASEVAERILETFAAPFEFDSLKLDIGASIGIAICPDHTDHARKLLQCADVAMYTAKVGTNKVCVYDQQADRNSIRHLTLTGDLRRAIEGREIYLAFQPIIDMGSGKIYGVECLARWNHPEHGQISPDEFIGQAERTGLIRELTDLTFDCAFSQASAWRLNGHMLRIAINVSAKVLHDENVPDLLMSCAQTYGVEPSSVSLEITESAFMANPDRALEMANRLTAMGFELAIDDFGTGYSSLSYLSRLPVGKLKIDKSFVMPMLERQNDRTIVQSTIDLAHGLGVTVVGEGISSADLLTELRDMNCDYGQGFEIGRPISAEEIEARYF
jgi:diguanylate cyclase (GGDEF)-like protein/PAS domain S-box-containing protein